MASGGTGRAITNSHSCADTAVLAGLHRHRTTAHARYARPPSGWDAPVPPTLIKSLWIMRFAVLLLALGLVASGTAVEAGGKTRKSARSRRHAVTHTSSARRNTQQRPTPERYQ